MGKSLRLPGVGMLVAVALCLQAAPVLAASAPANDTLAGATVVSALPFEQVLDTTSATTDSIDTQANANCGAPVTLASVWYDYTASTDDAVIVDVSQSTFEAGVIVVTGDPGSFELQACGPSTIAFEAAAGTTYHIMAFSDTAGINGGMLDISMQTAPPPPDVSLTVNPVGYVDHKTGVVTLSGSYTCSGVADFGYVEGFLSQRVGRFIISGSFVAGAPECDGTTQPWSAQLVGDNGIFSGGKAASVTYAIACGPWWCSEGYAEQKVQLKK